MRGGALLLASLTLLLLCNGPAGASEAEKSDSLQGKSVLKGAPKMPGGPNETAVPTGGALQLPLIKPRVDQLGTMRGVSRTQLTALSLAMWLQTVLCIVIAYVIYRWSYVRTIVRRKRP